MKYVFAGNQRIAKVTDLEVLYIHRDHLGSTSVVTDSMGEYPEGEPGYTEYQPYGLPRPGSELSNKTDYTFTDQEFDRSTGFYNYDARLYNPNIGMFITADSIIPDQYDSQQLNRYAYVRNNPLKYVDPSGHRPDSVSQVGRDPFWIGEEARRKDDQKTTTKDDKKKTTKIKGMKTYTITYNRRTGEIVNISESPTELAGGGKIILLLSRGHKTLAKGLSKDELVKAAQEGEDVLAKNRKAAKEIAQEAGGGKRPIHDSAHGPKKEGSYRNHYHIHGRWGGHIFYNFWMIFDLNDDGFVDDKDVFELVNPFPFPLTNSSVEDYCSVYPDRCG